jgi:hypothetical protein
VRDAAGVGDLVRPDTQLIGGKGAGTGLEDEVKGELGIEFETGQFGRGVADGVRDRGDTLAVTPDGQTEQLGRRELELVPFEGDRGLGDVAQSERGRRRGPLTELGEDLVLKRPELVGARLLGRYIASAGDGDDAAGLTAGREEERGKFDEVGGLVAKQDGDTGVELACTAV